MQLHIPHLPEPSTLSPELWTRLGQQRAANGFEICHVFTDGSAFNQECRWLPLRLLFAMAEILAEQLPW